MAEGHHSQSLERGLSILATFTPGQPLLGITELARAVGLGRSTTHRYVATLAALGYLEQDTSTQKYRLGTRVLDLGFSALHSMELREISSPYLHRLSDETGHTVNLAILDGTDIVYIERCRSSRDSPGAIDLNLHAGSRLPSYCTSLGKVLLAHLPDTARDALLDEIELTRRGPNTHVSRRTLVADLQRVRDTGIAVNNEELAGGLRSIAVPVRGPSGDVVAAINVAVHRSLVQMEELVTLLSPVLKDTAAKISARAGYCV
jgi:IclR family pca regulon transcriptional regulator